jgi:hypothetical protein
MHTKLLGSDCAGGVNVGQFEAMDAQLVVVRLSALSASVNVGEETGRIGIAGINRPLRFFAA